MRRTVLKIGLVGSLAFSSLASASTCSINTTATSWIFGATGDQACANGGTNGAGGNNAAQSYTDGNGQILNISPQQYYNDTGNFKGTPSTVDGLFEVQKGVGSNIASGIAPYDPTYGGGSPY